MQQPRRPALPADHECGLMIFISPLPAATARLESVTATIKPMKLRTRLNLIVAGLTAVFMGVLLAEEIQNTRTSVREEIEAANGVASQLLGRLGVIYSSTTCVPPALE